MDPMVESAWIAAAAAAIGVIGTATVGIVGYYIARSTNKSTIEAAHADVRRTLDATRTGQITDLYSRAIDQLGSEQLHVRIGGIYALERVARDSEQDHPLVMEVLTAFIREYSREQWPKTGPGRWTRPDIQAAVTVVGHRDVKRDTQRIDLYSAILIDAELNGANLRGATLRGANLTGAFLYDTILVDTDLRDVTHDGAHLHRDDLTRPADLTGAQWSPSKPLPEGWKLRIGSDGTNRLERRDAGASDSGQQR